MFQFYMKTWMRLKGEGQTWKAPGVAEETLNALVANDEGTWQSQITNTQGGRPTKVFTLHPHS